jgi:hypothetical protein
MYTRQANKKVEKQVKEYIYFGLMKTKPKTNPFVLLERRLLDSPEWVQIGSRARDILIFPRKSGHNEELVLA